MDIQFSGEKLTPMQQSDIVRQAEKLASKHLEINSMTVNVKKYSKTGLRGKYSIHLNVQTTEGYYKSDASGWTIWLAAKKATHGLRAELGRKQRGVKRAMLWHKRHI